MVLCGHSHQRHLIQLPDGPLILNPGSVGCPSYDDPGADPHVSESGSPYSGYAVLNIDGQNVSADMIALTYDWKTASARAEQMADQTGPTVYEQGGSWPIPAGHFSPPPLEPKGTADVRSICVIPWRPETGSRNLLRLPANTADAH